MLLLVASARAEEGPSRAEYVEQVEPICQANTVANKRILKDVKTKDAASVRPKSGKRARQFIHASIAFGATVRKIAAVPRPPADDARLLKWFEHLDIVQTNLRKRRQGPAGRQEDPRRPRTDPGRTQRKRSQQRQLRLRIPLLPADALALHLSAPVA